MGNEDRIRVLATVLIFHARDLVKAMEEDTHTELPNNKIVVLLLEEALKQVRG